LNTVVNDAAADTVSVRSGVLPPDEDVPLEG
jgi:hypothetical protein